MLTGKFHFASATDMQRLLEEEGIEVKHDQIVNFYSHFWDPQEHLKIMLK